MAVGGYSLIPRRRPGNLGDFDLSQSAPARAVSGRRLARVPCAARRRIPTAYVAVSRRLAGKGTSAPSSTIGMAATGPGQNERTLWVVPLITRASPARKRAIPE